MPGALFAGLAMVTGGAGAGGPARSPRPRRGCRRSTHYYGLEKRDILTGSNAVAPDRKIDVRQGDQRRTSRARSTTRISRCTCWCTPRCATRSAATNTATRACGSARRTSTKWSTTAGRHEAAADQRVELRPLQDVRHHGPVRRDHLGRARRRRRAAVPGDVKELRVTVPSSNCDAVPPPWFELLSAVVRFELVTCNL